MTIDQAIEALKAAKEQIGGGRPCWVFTRDMYALRDEELVEKIVPVNDGNNLYVRIVTVGTIDEI